MLYEKSVLTQYRMFRGIKKVRDDGIGAVLKHLQQSHDQGVLKPAEETSLIQPGDLAYLMFINPHRYGQIRGRVCADGQNTCSTKVSIEAGLTTCAIDEHEGRGVATIDIPEAFTQADMDHLVQMKLKGTMADLLMKIIPSLH
jgi:hypothetical protein